HLSARRKAGYGHGDRDAPGSDPHGPGREQQIPMVGRLGTQPWGHKALYPAQLYKIRTASLLYRQGQADRLADAPGPMIPGLETSPGGPAPVPNTDPIPS